MKLGLQLGGWIVLLALLGASSGAAQQPRVKPSQRGTVSQTVNTTEISITYDRPVARGRDLFGAVVRWGEDWTPGANWATTIELSRDVLVEGKPLEKGKYSIWTVPQPDEWTVIFSRRARAFHTRYPEGEDALRVNVRPIEGSHMETLAFYFPIVAADSTILHLHWGTTVVPISIKVQVPED